MTVRNIGILIDITDSTSDTSAAIGLISGVFYWITGRPGYVSGGYSGEAPASKTWKEGIISDSKMGTPIRMIDIIESGDYGSLSGFTFSIDNTSKFWNTLQTNSYYLINRTIKVYAFFDDVSYQIWTGTISEVKYNEIEYEIICEDKFKLAHKPIPPEKIDNIKFPDVIDNSIGKSIPVTIGNVNRAKIVNVAGTPEDIILGVFDTEEMRVAAAVTYTTVEDENPCLHIKTPNTYFSADYFIRSPHYLRVVRGTEQTIRIIGNDSTINGSGDGDYTRIYLDHPLSDIDQDSFITDSHNYINGSTNESSVWWFQILKLSVSYVASNASVTSFRTKNDGAIDMKHYNNDSEKYDDVTEFLEDYNESASNPIGFPFIKLASGSISISGNVEKYYPIVPDNIETIEASCNVSETTNEFTGSADNGKLIDKDRTTKVILSGTGTQILLRLNVRLPENFDNSLDGLFLAFDCDTNAVSLGGNWAASAIDSYANLTSPTAIADAYWPADKVSTIETTRNFLPNSYYESGGDDNGEISLWPMTSRDDVGDIVNVKDGFEILSTYVSDKSQLKINPKYQLYIYFSSNPPAGPLILYLKQVGFIGKKNINLLQDDFYIQTKGEQIDSIETNTTYRALQHIMETYDGITSTDISWGTYTATANAAYKVGRQLTEQKGSEEYIQELLKNTFTAIYPTRTGARGVSAWRNNRVPTITHDESLIIAGSITKFEKTPISKVYNDLTVNYDWNPGSGKFDKSIFVTKTDEDAFPTFQASTIPAGDAEKTFTSVSVLSTADIMVNAAAVFPTDPSGWASVGGYVSFSCSYGWIYFGTITAVNASTKTVFIEFENTYGMATGSYSSGTFYSCGSGIPSWKTFTGGIPDYATAKSWWDICHASYQRTLTKRQLPAELSDCYWFPDNDNFTTGTGGAGNAAYQYMQDLVEWITRQKDITEYSIPLNATNAVIEPLTPITFTDAIYTNDVERLMWITKVKPVFDVGHIVIEGLLEPTDIQTITKIIETGSAPDVIIEDGNGPDVYQEA